LIYALGRTFQSRISILNFYAAADDAHPSPNAAAVLAWELFGRPRGRSPPSPVNYRLNPERGAQAPLRMSAIGNDFAEMINL
jgi:hypothetical protein